MRSRSSDPPPSISRKICIFAKLDWAMTDFDSMQFSVKIRDEVSAGDQTGTGVAASAAVDTDNDDKRYRTVVEAQR